MTLLMSHDIVNATWHDTNLTPWQKTLKKQLKILWIDYVFKVVYTNLVEMTRLNLLTKIGT